MGWWPRLDEGNDFDAVRAFARQAAGLLAARNPDLVTTEQRKDKRGSRVYADIMRNAYAQTVVAPYAVRARPGAPVATPLHWDEVADSELVPGRFTLRTIRSRLGELEKATDPWAALTSRRCGLARAKVRLDEITGGGITPAVACPDGRLCGAGAPAELSPVPSAPVLPRAALDLRHLVPYRGVGGRVPRVDSVERRHQDRGGGQPAGRPRQCSHQGRTLAAPRPAGTSAVCRVGGPGRPNAGATPGGR